MYILIVNPEAGRGKALKLLKEIQQESLYGEANCRSFLTEKPGHAEQIAIQVTEKYHEILKAIIVLGGDGTLHEVVNGMNNFPMIPICFLPGGTGNDFARGINLKNKGLSLFHRSIKNPKSFSVNLGSFVLQKRAANGKRIFLNSIGFGLDGTVVAAANNLKYRRLARKLFLTKWIYPLALVGSIWKAEPIRFDLTIDGEAYPVRKAMMVTVSNHPYYGGGMKIAPEADIVKKDLYVLIVEPTSKKKLFLMFLSVFIGKHTKIKEVREVKAGSVNIRSNEVIPYQVDGQSGVCSECFVKKAERSAIFYVD